MTEEITKYGQEVAKTETKDNGKTETTAGDYAEELFNSEKLIFGSTNDPYKGIRGAHIPNPQRHTLIVGETGQGKTTTGFNLASQTPEDEAYLFISDTPETKERFGNAIPDSTIIQVQDSDAYGLGLFKNDDYHAIDHKADLVIDILKSTSKKFASGPPAHLTRQLITVMIRDEKSTSFKDLYRYLSDRSSRENLFSRVDDTDVPPKLAEEFEETNISEFLPIRHCVQKLAENDITNKFSMPGEKRTLSVKNLAKSIQNGDKLVIQATRKKLIGDILANLYATAAEETHLRDPSNTQAHLFFDGRSNTELSRKLGIKLSKARGYNLSMTFMMQQFQPNKHKLDNNLSMNCSNIIVLSLSDIQTANQCASIFEHGRNHLMNQELRHYTAKILNKHGETVTIKGELFPKRA